MIGAVFHAHTERVEHKIDTLGAVLLAGSLSSIVLFTSLGGTLVRVGLGADRDHGACSVAVLLVLFVFSPSAGSGADGCRSSCSATASSR